MQAEMKSRESARLDDGSDEHTVLTPQASSGAAGCCSRCCSVYERVVAVLLPVCAIVNLACAAPVGWRWGVAVGIVGLLLSIPAAYDQYTSWANGGARPLRDTLRIWVLFSLTTCAAVLWPYVLITALVQIVPQTNQPHWPALRDDGFPTSCPQAARNCVRLGNGTDIYAAGKPTDMVAPQLGGSSVQVLDKIEAWVVSQGGVVVFRSQQVVRAIFTTFVMGYRDDFAAYVFCDDSGRSVANLQSQSRLGIGDMGANAERLNRLLHALKEACPAALSGVRIDATGRRSIVEEDGNAARRRSPSTSSGCDSQCIA